jgi:hypothetical protein
MWTPDKQAESILFDAYWTPKGWKRVPTTPPDDFAYAKQAGYMFDPVTVDHDLLVAELIHLRSRLNAVEVGQAFSDSLTTGRLDLRSALGSYGAILRLPKHRLYDFLASHESTSRHTCPLCKFYVRTETEDINVLNFERFKWGGVRHHDPLYALLDLQQFEAAGREPHAQTLEPLFRILDAASNAPASARPNDLIKMIAPHLPGNRAQRRIVIGILGHAGILQPGSHPGFFDGYPTDRESPRDAKNDWPYPVLWWRGRDGVNAAALAYYFPDLKI